MAVLKQLREMAAEFYVVGIKHLVLRHECLNKQGNYVENWVKHVESINKIILKFVVLASFFTTKRPSLKKKLERNFHKCEAQVKIILKRSCFIILLTNCKFIDLA